MVPTPSPAPPRTTEGQTAPPLWAVRCRGCGRTAVPAQEFGCEQCGAHGAELKRVVLGGRGTVLAAVTVERHPDPQRSASFVLGSVQLAEGPVVRAELLGRAGVGSEVAVAPGRGADGGVRIAFAPVPVRSDR